LSSASRALRDELQELAPPGPHLTPERLGRIMAARTGPPKLFRLVTYRQFVAAAAAAAILISAAFIAHTLVRVWRQPAATPQREALGVRRPVGPSTAPVLLTTMGQGDPLDVVRSVPAPGSRLPDWGETISAVHLIGANSAGLSVPVDHAFYDAEESSRWW
jgi:hypothetical protein